MAGFHLQICHCEVCVADKPTNRKQSLAADKRKLSFGGHCGTPDSESSNYCVTGSWNTGRKKPKDGSSGISIDPCRSPRDSLLQGDFTAVHTLLATGKAWSLLIPG